MRALIFCDQKTIMLARITEPELMVDEAQVEAYAKADFSEPHQSYVELCQSRFAGNPVEGWVLDLGCGTGDVTFRFARAFLKTRLVGVDGSTAMLRWAKNALKQDLLLAARIQFLACYLPQKAIPNHPYSAIISNSLLHHLSDPMVLWHTIRAYGCPGAQICIMDLRRPDTEAEARLFVNSYASNESEILQRDFYNSLRAAFTPEEVRQQLICARMNNLEVESISNRHLLVSGKL
ncbi:MAG: class I SAM-dependent methyltransferase [Verrucomicrobiota bacterium]